MASSLATGNHTATCGKCSRFVSVEYVGEFGVRYECGCAEAGTGCWCLPKDGVMG
jgi:hypothetical protein